MTNAVATGPTTTRRSTTRAGWIVTGLISAFMLSDSVGKLLVIEPVREAMDVLGYPVYQSRLIGAVLLVCLALYLIPRTAVLGALLTACYCGGAEAAQIRIESPIFSLIFPIACGVLIWLGLWLRDERVRALLPLRRG
ncbi:MAG TPA: DoxX family protein [Propionibacteriaceae bacterium]